MEGNNKINDKDLIELYVEIIAWGTFFGLIFPLIFLWSNINKVPACDKLLVFPNILIPLTALFYLLLTGKIFKQRMKSLSLKAVRLILYIWGFLLLIFTSVIIHLTGGIQTSIFIWLFEYGLIVTILVRPEDEKSFLKHWRPVLITAAIEVLFIIILIAIGKFASPMPDEIQKSMPIWGGVSVFFSLIASFFLFYIKINNNKRGKEKKCIN